MMVQQQDSAHIAVSNLEAEQKRLATRNAQHESDLKDIIGHAEALSTAVESLEAELANTRAERDNLAQRVAKLSETQEWTLSRGRMAQMLADEEGKGPAAAEEAREDHGGLSNRLSNLSQRMKLANISEAGGPAASEADALLEPGVGKEIDQLAELLEIASKELQICEADRLRAAEESSDAHQRIAEMQAKLAAKEAECLGLLKSNRSLAIENQCTMELVSGGQHNLSAFNPAATAAAAAAESSFQREPADLMSDRDPAGSSGSRSPRSVARPGWCSCLRFNNSTLTSPRMCTVPGGCISLSQKVQLSLVRFCRAERPSRSHSASGRGGAEAGQPRGERDTRGQPRLDGHRAQRDSVCLQSTNTHHVCLSPVEHAMVMPLSVFGCARVCVRGGDSLARCVLVCVCVCV